MTNRSLGGTAVAIVLLASWAAPMDAQVLTGVAPASSADTAKALSARVEVVRTEYGIPHIYAEDWKAFGFAMGWVQSEDYGDQVAVGIVRRRGEYGRYTGRDSIRGDFAGREAHAVAVARYSSLEPRVRAVYEGFAEGVNEYARQNPDVFPEWLVPNFTGVDALTNDVYTWSRGDAAAFVRAQTRRESEQMGQGNTPAPAYPDSWGHAEELASTFDPAVDGSNAWALDGTRTASGDAILLRNPHLSWEAGYYEAHVQIRGDMEFYGDFRIGGAFGIIGGFNRHLGWATTNNSPSYSQVYAVQLHPSRDGPVSYTHLTLPTILLV